jgi:hypothetical protein
LESRNVKKEFSTWFHTKAPMVYKKWYRTNLIKKLDEMENAYYESFNEKLFEIDPENIQNFINTIKENMNNRYNVQNISFAEYDRRNQNGKPKSILNNLYTKYLSGLYGGTEIIDTEKQLKTEESMNNFPYKDDVRDILAKDLGAVEAGLALYKSDGNNGVKYSAGGKYIDILAIDKDGNYVVIEIDYGKGDEMKIGEVLRNKNWIERNMAKAGEKVRGIIISNEITEDLMMACMNLSEIELYEYEIFVKIKRKQVS